MLSSQCTSAWHRHRTRRLTNWKAVSFAKFFFPKIQQVNLKGWCRRWPKLSGQHFCLISNSLERLNYSKSAYSVKDTWILLQKISWVMSGFDPQKRTSLWVWTSINSEKLEFYIKWTDSMYISVIFWNVL